MNQRREGGVLDSVPEGLNFARLGEHLEAQPVVSDTDVALLFGFELLSIILAIGI